MSRAALWAVLVALFGLATMALAWSATAAPKRDQLTLVTDTGSHVINVEVVESDGDKALGLMFRTSVPENTGMLFPYSPPQEITMWMKNTYVPLDMVFIGPDGTVHRIEARTEPLSERIIPSRGPAAAVLELAGGAAQKLGLKPGDRVLHPIFKTAAPGRD